MSLMDRVKYILLQPAYEWRVIEKEPSSIGKLYASYIMPLAAIGPVASIIGLAFVGINIPFVGNYRVPLASAIAYGVVNYVLALVGVYVLALLIDLLAPRFRGVKSNLQAVKVIAYSSTAAWLCAIFNIMPAIAFLQILGLYSLYLLYLGVPVVMKVPADRALGYTLVVIVAGIIVFAVIGAVSAMFVSYPGSSIQPVAP